MLISRFVPSLALALVIAGCSQPTGTERGAQNEPAVEPNADPIEGSVQAPANDSEPGAAAPVPANSASEPEPASAGCERVSAVEAQAFTDLRLTGTSGPYRFFGEDRKLLCSEPGAGGRGECELVGPTTVRVEGPTGTYGFRASSDAILTYAPDGLTCSAR